MVTADSLRGMGEEEADSISNKIIDDLAETLTKHTASGEVGIVCTLALLAKMFLMVGIPKEVASETIKNMFENTWDHLERVH